jgi:putative ABC transport system permease protein
MFKNYIKSALRFLKHNRAFAVINLIGLSIALAVSFIILLFVINELSYDHFNINRDRAFKVINYHVDLKQKFSETPYILTTALIFHRLRKL